LFNLLSSVRNNLVAQSSKNDPCQTKLPTAYQTKYALATSFLATTFENWKSFCLTFLIPLNMSAEEKEDNGGKTVVCQKKYCIFLIRIVGKTEIEELFPDLTSGIEVLLVSNLCCRFFVTEVWNAIALGPGSAGLAGASMPSETALNQKGSILQV